MLACRRVLSSRQVYIQEGLVAIIHNCSCNRQKMALRTPILSEENKKRLYMFLSKTPVFSLFLKQYIQKNNPIWHVSYKKTGRTWLRTLIGKAMQLHFDTDESEIFLLPITKSQDHGFPGISFYHDDAEIYSNLKKRLREQRFIYPPYLGITEFLATVNYVAEGRLEKNSNTSVDINLTLIGIPSVWYNVKPKILENIAPNNETVFLVEFNIPANAQLGDYDFEFFARSPYSYETRKSKLRIFASQDELIREDLKKPY